VKSFEIVNASFAEDEHAKEQCLTDTSLIVLKQTIDRACARFFIGAVSPIVLLWSILRWEPKRGVHLIAECGVDLNKFECEVSRILGLMGKEQREDAITPVFDFEPVAKCVTIARQEATLLGQSYIGTEHLVLALLKAADPVLNDLFNRFDFTYAKYREALARSS
jgi:ATP-dependent Clp protease ATP-binding subunit ClpA